MASTSRPSRWSSSAPGSMRAPRMIERDKDGGSVAMRKDSRRVVMTGLGVLTVVLLVAAAGTVALVDTEDGGPVTAAGVERKDSPGPPRQKSPPAVRSATPAASAAEATSPYGGPPVDREQLQEAR